MNKRTNPRWMPAPRMPKRLALPPSIGPRLAWAPAVAALLALAACSRPTLTAQEEVRPVRSTVAGISNGTLEARYAGEIQARYQSKLAFQTSGRIVARQVEVGSVVRRGQPLLQLDPAQETLHVLAADADVDAAKSRVAQNRIDLQRTEALLARSFASPAEAEQQRLALAQSESQLQGALAQQQLKRNQRGYTTLVADRDGVVTALQAEAGQVVSPGQAVVTLAGDGEREVLVSIPESRVDELRRARSLQVSVWAHPDRRWTGVLRELAPDTDNVTRTYAARISVQGDHAALRLGMTATVLASDVSGGEQAIRLPLSAIHHQGAQPQVWVVNAASSRVAPRAVQLGAAQNDEVLVRSGIAPGEIVVTAGVHMLHAGQPVKTSEAAAVAQASRAAVPPSTGASK